jgi:hypothetical protein
VIRDGSKELGVQCCSDAQPGELIRCHSRINDPEPALALERAKCVGEGIDVSLPTVGQVEGGDSGMPYSLARDQSSHSQHVRTEHASPDRGCQIEKVGTDVRAGHQLRKRRAHRIATGRGPIADHSSEERSLGRMFAVQGRLGYARSRMTALDHLPVLLLGHRAEVLASNALFGAVLRELPSGSSFPRFLFLDPLARERILNWSQFASTLVASLRRDAARHPHDRRLTSLIDERRDTDADVARWWDDHGVRDYASVAKIIRHPLVGDLSFDIEIVSPPRDPDQLVYTTEPGSPTAGMLPVLAGWQHRSHVTHAR